ncbi:MAG: GNAT family N-acetyltransferase [Chloroflexales bacterium]|nr:GNAT family N-acetyltransferase [Chloroflexales bacterium]
MWLFRKSLDISRAVPRLITSDDLTAVSRLLRDGVRRYYGLSGSDLLALLAANQGMVLDSGSDLFAVAIVSWPAAATCWLRGFACADGVDARNAAAALIPALHQALAARGVREIYYAGDEAADAWLVPALETHGYRSETEVVVYEKANLDIPDGGNPDVQVRPATSVDLAEVLSLDQACFEPQWTKDDTILGPAIEHGAYFVVAELDQALVGYAFATSHFGGRLVHLVRIAVDPRRRGERIGVRLLAEVVIYANEQSATVVTLNTQAYNARAQRLYRWFGFNTTGERQPVLRCTL